jgi:hypothetical protein
MGLVVRQFSESTSLRYEDRGLERPLKVQNRNKKKSFCFGHAYQDCQKSKIQLNKIFYFYSTP